MTEPDVPRSSHGRVVRDEFTKQAALFAAAPEMRDEEALRRLIELAGAGPGDTALDVACGPGIVVCALARVVAHATGIDLTPAMIERARALQAESGLENVAWRVGDVRGLPFADGSFSLVTTRYSVHHFEDPRVVVAEMVRVCASGGRVVVVDAVASDVAAKRDAFNRMERQRDPSHVRALTLAEHHGLLADEGLSVADTALYRLDFDVETLVEGSFPADGDRDALRRVFRDAVADDALGMNVRDVNGALVCSYPIAMLLARR